MSEAKSAKLRFASNALKFKILTKSFASLSHFLTGQNKFATLVNSYRSGGEHAPVKLKSYFIRNSESLSENCLLKTDARGPPVEALQGA
jgi:hypothetical protein